MPYKDPQKQKQYRKEYYNKHREEAIRNSKIYREANLEKVKANSRRYYKENAEVIKQKVKIYRDSHKEEILKQKKEWARDNPEKRRAICKRYYEKKKEEDPEYFNKKAMNHYNKDKDKSRKRLREYRKSRPAWTRLQKYLRRTRCGDGQVDKEHLNKEFEGLVIEKLKGQNYKCVYCGVDIKENFSIDHIIPLSKGGTNEIGNIDLVCKPCNTKKGTRSKVKMLEIMGAI